MKSSEIIIKLKEKIETKNLVLEPLLVKEIKEHNTITKEYTTKQIEKFKEINDISVKFGHYVKLVNVMSLKLDKEINELKKEEEKMLSPLIKIKKEFEKIKVFDIKKAYKIFSTIPSKIKSMNLKEKEDIENATNKVYEEINEILSDDKNKKIIEVEYETLDKKNVVMKNKIEVKLHIKETHGDELHVSILNKKGDKDIVIKDNNNGRMESIFRVKLSEKLPDFQWNIESLIGKVRDLFLQTARQYPDAIAEHIKLYVDNYGILTKKELENEIGEKSIRVKYWESELSSKELKNKYKYYEKENKVEKFEKEYIFNNFRRLEKEIEGHIENEIYSKKLINIYTEGYNSLKKLYEPFMKGKWDEEFWNKRFGTITVPQNLEYNKLKVKMGYEVETPQIKEENTTNKKETISETPIKKDNKSNTSLNNQYNAAETREEKAVFKNKMIVCSMINSREILADRLDVKPLFKEEAQGSFLISSGNGYAFLNFNLPAQRSELMQLVFDVKGNLPSEKQISIKPAKVKQKGQTWELENKGEIILLNTAIKWR